MRKQSHHKELSITSHAVHQKMGFVSARLKLIFSYTIETKYSQCTHLMIKYSRIVAMQGLPVAFLLFGDCTGIVFLLLGQRIDSRDCRGDNQGDDIKFFH